LVIGGREHTAAGQVTDMIMIPRGIPFGVISGELGAEFYVLTGPAFRSDGPDATRMEPAVDGNRGWSDQLWYEALKAEGFERGIIPPDDCSTADGTTYLVTELRKTKFQRAGRR
jgi:hypothetical protein